MEISEADLVLTWQLISRILLFCLFVFFFLIILEGMGEAAQATWQIPLQKLPLSPYERRPGAMPKDGILTQVMRNLWQKALCG